MEEIGTQCKNCMFMVPFKKWDKTHQNEEDLIKIACSLGWDVMLVPSCNRCNYPVLKAMFNVTMETFESTFYGYSNADILYGEDLLQSLKFLSRQDIPPQSGLIIGRRWNAKVRLFFFLHF